MGTPDADSEFMEELGQSLQPLLMQTRRLPSRCNYYPSLEILPSKIIGGKVESSIAVNSNTAGRFGGGLCLQVL